MGNLLAAHSSHRGHGWTKISAPIRSRQSDPQRIPTLPVGRGSPAATTSSTSSSGASLSSATSSSSSSPAQSFSSMTPINTSPTVKWKARDAIAKRVQESDEEEELDDDLDDFGYGSARQRSNKGETLIGKAGSRCISHEDLTFDSGYPPDILNSGPPDWMQNPSRESATDSSNPRVKKRSGLFARAKQSAGIASHPTGGCTSESIAAAFSKSIRLSRSSGSLFRTGRVGSLGNATGSSRTTKAQEQAQAADDFARSLDPDTRKISLQMAESSGSESLMSFLRSTKADEASYSPGESTPIGGPFRLPRSKPASVGSSDKVQDVHDSAPSPTRVFFHDLKVALEGNPMMTTHRGQRPTTGGHSSSGDWEAGMHEDASLASQWVSGDELTRLDSLGVAGQEILASPPRSGPSTPRHLSYTSQELDKSPGARRSSTIARDSTSSVGGSPISPSASEASLTSSKSTSQQSTSTARRISRKPVPRIEDTVPELDSKPFERKYEARYRPEDDTGPIATGESPIKGRSENGSIASPGGDDSPVNRKSHHGAGSTSQTSGSQRYNGPQRSSKLHGASQSTIQDVPAVLPFVLSASTTPPPGTPFESKSTAKVDAITHADPKTNHKAKPRPENLTIPPTSSTVSACASDQEMPTSARSSLESGSRRRAARRITPPPKTPLPNAPGGSAAQVKAGSVVLEQVPAKEGEDGGSATIIVGYEELPSAQSTGSSPDSWTSIREGQQCSPGPLDVNAMAVRPTIHPNILSALKELRTSMSDTATLDILPEVGTAFDLVLPTLSGMRTQFTNAVALLDIILQLYGPGYEANEGRVVECLLGDSI